MRRLSSVVLAVFLPVSRVAAQEAGQVYERYQRGIAALEAKDAVRALPDLEAAAAVFARDPDALYAVAKARALTQMLGLATVAHPGSWA